MRTTATPFTTLQTIRRMNRTIAPVIKDAIEFELPLKPFDKYILDNGVEVYSIYAAYLLFDKTGVIDWAKEHHSESIVQSMKATKPWIEETREFFGLLIVITVLVINMVWLKRKAAPADKT